MNGAVAADGFVRVVRRDAMRYATCEKGGMRPPTPAANPLRNGNGLLAANTRPTGDRQPSSVQGNEKRPARESLAGTGESDRRSGSHAERNVYVPPAADNRHGETR